MLAIYEYYYDDIYKPSEIEMSGDAKRKVETYQYKILRSLSKEIEDKISKLEMPDFERRVVRMKNHPEDISRLVGDGLKRVLKVDEILKKEDETALQASKTTVIDAPQNQGVSKSKLKEYKEALEEGLITAEEYEKAKKEFLGESN